MREIQARVYLPHVAPEVADLVETGFLKPCIFDLKDGVYTKEFAKKVQTLPRFELSARPLEIPPALLALSPDSEVIFRCNESDTVKPAWLVLSIFRGKMERQAKGLFELSEAAEILSESCKGARGQAIPSKYFTKSMAEAFFSGVLPFFNDGLILMNPMNEDETFNFGGYGETTTPQAINAWLESTGSPHRFPDAVVMLAPLVEAVPAPQASPEPVQAAPAKRVLASEVQDAAILAAIREAGHDPLALPRNSPGKRGIKAVIRNALVGVSGSPFPKIGKQFDKSWERLREREEIADA